MTTEAEMPALLVRVAGILCALPVGCVVETMRPLPVIPADAADASAFVRGIAIIRGSATPVVDLAARPDHAPGERARFVTMRVGGGVVALAVDEVVALSRFPRDPFFRRPSLLARLDHGVAQSIAAEDQALHTVLETARVVNDTDTGTEPDTDRHVAGVPTGRDDRRAEPPATGHADGVAGQH